MFEVGKEVVAIIDHSQGVFKKGDVFTLKGIKQGCCSEKPLDIDIGIKRDGILMCRHCLHEEYTSIWWFNSTSFVPLDDISISELTEVLEKKPFEL